MIAVSRQGETLDEVCWRALGATAAVTEQVFELNPGLADHGPRLPAGLEIILPDSLPAAAAPKSVKLWD